MIYLQELRESLAFPDPNSALDDPNGLLAFGGDLSIQRLKQAYYQGVFPWFGEGEPLLWWSPNPRGVLAIADFNPSKSLKKLVRQKRYRVTINTAFAEVIQACASVPRGGDGVWITDEMIQAYQALHEHGCAHSVEVWEQNDLVGGLYGVSVGAVFCGESMFHIADNASKLALYYLVDHLKQHDYQFIDTQLQNPHLASLGVSEVPRIEFLQCLRSTRDALMPASIWAERTVEL